MDKQVETQMTSSNNFPPHVYDNGMSIMSKFSDVTTPTQHDGFELDEIVERKEKTMPQLLLKQAVELVPIFKARH